MPLRQLHFCHRKFHPVIPVDAKVTGGARQTSGRITTSGAVKLTSLHCCPGLWATSIGRNVEAKLLVGWYRMCIVSPALHINIRIIYIYYTIYVSGIYSRWIEGPYESWVVVLMNWGDGSKWAWRGFSQQSMFVWWLLNPVLSWLWFTSIWLLFIGLFKHIYIYTYRATPVLVRSYIITSRLVMLVLLWFRDAIIFKSWVTLNNLFIIFKIY